MLKKILTNAFIITILFSCQSAFASYNLLNKNTVNLILKAPQVFSSQWQILSVKSFGEKIHVNLPVKKVFNKINIVRVTDPEGYIYAKSKQGEVRIPDAIVSLYWLNPDTQGYELWPAKEYNQDNSQTTKIEGSYSFLVPAGEYYLEVVAAGYQTYKGQSFKIEDGNGAHQNIELKPYTSWIDLLDWKVSIAIVAVLFLLYNFYRDRKRDNKINKINQKT